MTLPDLPLPAQVGRYCIVRTIGQGAMGRVLLAHDTVLDRDVALKYLRNDLNLSAEQRSGLLDRMRQEARASARVSHPNLVMLHDMGEDDQIGLFLVFEYAEGQTLKERLAAGAMPAAAVAELAVAMGEALTIAHAAGVLHRDIKPENIILTRTGPKLADFGIAKVPDSTLTRDGGLLGTPAYSAPEALSDGFFSPNSDQFSMAATLWGALSGRRAFPGTDAVAVASRIAIEEPPMIHALCGLDPRVDTVLSRGLSKNPGARFASCEEFGWALARALRLSPRGSQATLPDHPHSVDLRHASDLVRAASHAQVPASPLPRESRTLRIAVGGVAVGGLLVFAAIQLPRSLHRDPLPLPDLSSRTSATTAMPNAIRTAEGSDARRSRLQRTTAVESATRAPRDRTAPSAQPEHGSAARTGGGRFGAATTSATATHKSLPAADAGTADGGGEEPP